MDVEFEFDEEKIRALGYTLNDVHYTIKKESERYGLPCTSESEVIIFEGNDHEDDFANMWLGIKDLINSSWFLKCASACRWYDWSDNDEEEIVEDVFSHAHHLIRAKM